MKKIFFLVTIFFAQITFSADLKIKDEDKCVTQGEIKECLGKYFNRDYIYQSVIRPWGYTQAPSFSYTKIKYKRTFGSTTCNLIGMAVVSLDIVGFVYDCFPTNNKIAKNPANTDIKQYFDKNYGKMPLGIRETTGRPTDKANSYIGSDWGYEFLADTEKDSIIPRENYSIPLLYIFDKKAIQDTRVKY